MLIRKGSYRKIHLSINADRKFRELSPAAQLLWFRLLTGKYSIPIPGVILASGVEIAAALDWPYDPDEAAAKGFSKAFPKAFEEVFSKGMAKGSFEAHLVWLPKAINYNSPESPNVVRHWAKHWPSVPECDLKDEIFETLRDFTKGLDVGFAKAFEQGFAKAYGEAVTVTVIKEQQVSVSKKIEKKTPKRGRRETFLKDFEPALVTFAQACMSSLNRLTGRKMQVTAEVCTLITKRLAEGREKARRGDRQLELTINEFLAVIEVKCKAFQEADMSQHCRPSTLFGSKFFKYLDEDVCGAPKRIEEFQQLGPQKRAT
jgi:uncharacterized phage protein (TIGR02220 family)